MRRMPDRPARRPSQVAFAPTPSGETAPTPVTTMRFTGVSLLPRLVAVRADSLTEAPAELLCWPGAAAKVFRPISRQVYEIRDFRGDRRSNHVPRRSGRGHGREAELEIRDRQCAHVAIDPFDQTRDHVAGTELEESCGAGRGHILDRSGPIHRALDLTRYLIANRADLGE